MESELYAPHDTNDAHLAPEHDDDGDTASQRSISLSSPSHSRNHSTHEHTNDVFAAISSLSGTSEPTDRRQSHPATLLTEFSSEGDDESIYTQEVDLDTRPSSVFSVVPSQQQEHEEEKDHIAELPTYPPTPAAGLVGDTESVASFSSATSRKARPESLLVQPPTGPLVLGVALVDFNHIVGPKIEFYKGDIFEDEEIAKILPFLALPDGAHLSAEDYSYFHMVPSTPNPSTIFGISCNRQIRTTDLLVKDEDMTRSTVQKAVVVLASKPVFGPIRDRLGVVTRALFDQRDFREVGILNDFAASLEISLRSQLTESGLYMGTSLRELVHTFRQKTLVLLKTLILQKKIMFYGHPVERLCTYQYSLISLIPGLLQHLEDCGSPPLAARSRTLERPNSLRTSDRKSMMAYLGLPLDIFGKDAFFQPYLPLQQLDLIQGTHSWLCGSTNVIVMQRKEIDLLVNTEEGTVEFRDPKLERLVGLTAADRKWMDDIVRDVNETWDEEDHTRILGMQFKGSDDYLRLKFEEYISAALASVKYQEFISKGENSGVLITGGTGGDANSILDFNPVWIAEFKNTNAYEVWSRITDPLLFDIVEPRHPCNEKPSVVTDIGLRLQEGIQDLKLEQQLAPARESITRTFNAGSAGFFKAVEGVRDRWNQRTVSSTSTIQPAHLDTPKPDADVTASAGDSPVRESPPEQVPASPVSPDGSAATPRPASQISQTSAKISTWGAGIGSFLSTKASQLAAARAAQSPTITTEAQPPTTSDPTSPSAAPSVRSSLASFRKWSSFGSRSSETSASESRPQSQAASIIVEGNSSTPANAAVSVQSPHPVTESTDEEHTHLQPRDLGTIHDHDHEHDDHHHMTSSLTSDSLESRGSYHVDAEPMGQAI